MVFQIKNNLRFIPIILSVCSLYLLSCEQKNAANESKEEKIEVVAPNEDSLVMDLSTQVLKALKDKNYEKFTEFFHPELGVRFSPYGHVDTKSDLQFDAHGLLKRHKKKKVLHWGFFDGSGDSILLTTSAYFEKFVYNVDFLNAEKTTLNEMVGHGNSLNNLKEMYPNSMFTESYFSGFDPKYDGMDWCCLRLVFQKHENQFYLVGVVHDQWTI